MDARTNPRGFTLVELIVSMAISAIIATLAIVAIVGLDRDQTERRKASDLQTFARLALSTIEDDLRHAALANGTGVIWTNDSGARISRPAAQIFYSAPGGGFIDIKPNTDALLIVGALRNTTIRAALAGDLTTSTGAIPVTKASVFTVGTPVLLGDYGDASWGLVQTVTSSGTVQQISLKNVTVNVIPGIQVQRLPSGSSVRAARAHLYYVDTADELVQLTLSVPRAPLLATQVTGRAVLGYGFENLKLDCRLDDNAGGFTGCPDALAVDVVTTEAENAFGNFGGAGTHQGAALTVSNIGLLRTITVNAAVRSRFPLADGAGDPKVPLGLWSAVTLPVGGASDTAPYVRRTFSLTSAIRNTSLGAF